MKCHKECPIETIREMETRIVTKTLIPKWSPKFFTDYNLRIIIKRLNSRYIDYRIAKQEIKVKNLNVLLRASSNRSTLLKSMEKEPLK